MNNLNSVLIEGELTSEAELTRLDGDRPFCFLVLRSVRTTRASDPTAAPVKETSRFFVHVYGQQAEMCAKYLTKGRTVRVVGRLRNDPEDASEAPRAQIIAEHVEFRPPVKAEFAVETEEEKAARERDSAATGGVDPEAGRERAMADRGY